MNCVIALQIIIKIILVSTPRVRISRRLWCALVMWIPLLSALNCVKPFRASAQDRDNIGKKERGVKERTNLTTVWAFSSV